MEQVCEQRLTVTPSASDADGLLSHPAVFGILQDIATAHAGLLGLGVEAMRKRSLFWLTVKVKAIISRRPAIGEALLLRTWPDKPGTLRCTRSYEIVGAGGTLIRARTEWAVISTETQRLVPIADVFPPELSYDRPPVFAAPFPRIPDRFADVAPFARYTVSSSDIDLGGHMNNAAYPRALFSSFSMAERRALDARTVDLIYRAPCYEGETLELRRKELDGAVLLRVSRGEEPVLFARLSPREEA